MSSQHIQLISDQAALEALISEASQAPALALDIETINWWDRENERIALVQLAFRDDERPDAEPRVAVIDALAGVDLEPLRAPLELSARPKAIHNASYDAVRLSRHLRIRTSPIHDTMLAARRSGERKCSLQAQVEAHLGLRLDKTSQRSDWSRRPLDAEQLQYAALDASCTLRLYERQIARGLRGDYELREPPTSKQESLPLMASIRLPLHETGAAATPEAAHTEAELSGLPLALLGIVAELNGRYSPEHLAVSVGSERVGLVGWIIDRMIGTEADVDEGSARLEIAALCERGLLRLSLTRRLEATPAGSSLWQRHKA
ncbi:MAG TPA: ribonuclease D [Blastocatellia bacterium]|nr:ribonuclease D [Blastocatellia bacterium]